MSDHVTITACFREQPFGPRVGDEDPPAERFRAVAPEAIRVKTGADHVFLLSRNVLLHPLR